MRRRADVPVGEDPLGVAHEQAHAVHSVGLRKEEAVLLEQPLGQLAGQVLRRADLVFLAEARHPERRLVLGVAPVGAGAFAARGLPGGDGGLRPRGRLRGGRLAGGLPRPGGFAASPSGGRGPGRAPSSSRPGARSASPDCRGLLRGGRAWPSSSRRPSSSRPRWPSSRRAPCPGTGRSLPRPCLLLGAGHRRPVYDETSARYSRGPAPRPAAGPAAGAPGSSAPASAARRPPRGPGTSPAGPGSAARRGPRGSCASARGRPRRAPSAASAGRAPGPRWRLPGCRRRRISRTVRVRSRKYSRRSPCSLFTSGIAFANCSSVEAQALLQVAHDVGVDHLERLVAGGPVRPRRRVLLGQGASPPGAEGQDERQKKPRRSRLTPLAGLAKRVRERPVILVGEAGEERADTAAPRRSSPGPRPPRPGPRAPRATRRPRPAAAPTRPAASAPGARPARGGARRSGPRPGPRPPPSPRPARARPSPASAGAPPRSSGSTLRRIASQ